MPSNVIRRSGFRWLACLTTAGMVVTVATEAWSQAPRNRAAKARQSQQTKQPQQVRQFSPGGEFGVVITGTGAPVFNIERAGPSVLVYHKGQYVLVDMGLGTQRHINEMNLNTSNLAALAFTHHHLDHNEEFIPILVRTLVRRGKLEIVGPAGTKDFVDFVLKFYDEDMAYRSRRTRRDKSEPIAAPVRELEGGESFELLGMQVTTTAVNHSIATFAYRFDAGGKSIVISGDLTYTPELAVLAKDADILIIDSGSVIKQGAERRASSNSANNSQKNGAKGGREDRAHSSLEEIAKMAGDANVAHLVLTHFTTGDNDEAETLAVLREQFSGEVTFAEDLMEFTPQ